MILKTQNVKFLPCGGFPDLITYMKNKKQKIPNKTWRTVEVRWTPFYVCHGNSLKGSSPFLTSLYLLTHTTAFKASPHLLSLLLGERGTMK